MEGTLALLIPFGGLALAFGIVYLSVTASNREKLAMIEKGMNPNENKENSSKGADSLRRGLFLAGAAFGLFIGFLLHTYLNMDEVLALISMAFLFGGLGLITFYLIDKKNKQKN